MPHRNLCIALSALAGVVLTVTIASAQPVVFTFDVRDLALVEQRIAAADEATVAALQTLTEKAERRLKEGPFSVVVNDHVPPSGDKHDYVSQAPYWWPDPKQKDGLPYVRRDGRVNPESQGGDDEQLDDMAQAAWQLSLAWRLTGDRRYADHAAELLRVWFFAPETRMKPRLTYGPFIPGHNTGRGEGLIETRIMLKVLDADGLLAGSEAWTVEDHRQLQAWLRDFLDWMQESERGREERLADNNHGTWYDAQAAAYALFIGDAKRAERILRHAKDERFEDAFDSKGRPKYELERTKAFDYSMFHLDGLMHLATLGSKLDMNLWNAKLDDGRGLPKAIQWLAPYAGGEKEWPYKQILPPKSERVAILFRRAANAYGRPEYEMISSARRDPEDDDVTIALELVYPKR